MIVTSTFMKWLLLWLNLIAFTKPFSKKTKVSNQKLKIADVHIYYYVYIYVVVEVIINESFKT